MIKHHPQNRRERLLMNKKIKFGNLPIKDRPGHVRRKLAREAEEVKEFQNDIGEIALGADPKEAT